MQSHYFSKAEKIKSYLGFFPFALTPLGLPLWLGQDGDGVEED